MTDNDTPKTEADGSVERSVRPCAWAHRYSPRGLLHTLRDNQQDAEDDAAIVGGSAHAVPLYDEATLEAAVAAERERLCAAIKAEDDHCTTEGDYMLDSDDCISVIRGTWNPEA